jgi:short subunit fatty acids transporter
MVFKWTLLAFGIAMVTLVVLGKVLAFMNPPRPGRPRPPLLRRVERTVRWMLLIPLAVALVMLALALGVGR